MVFAPIDAKIASMNMNLCLLPEKVPRKVPQRKTY